MNALALNLSACRSMFCLLVSALMYLPVLPHAAELRKPAPSPSDALFDPSRVIQIEIRLDPKDWHALRISHPVVDENGEISPTEKGYKYYRSDVVIDGQLVTSVGVRKKGSGTSVSTRPSLKIKLDEYVKGQELGGLEVLTFNNNLQDESQARHWLAYSVMRKAGVPAPRCNLVRVVVNGENLGIYTHLESVREPFLESWFGESMGDVYEGGLNCDFTREGFDRFVHKAGKDRDREHLQKLTALLERSPQASLHEIGEMLDLSSFNTFWAATMLVHQFDSFPGNCNNVYVWRNSKSGRLHFIPWGADTAFGRSWKPHSVRAASHLCWRLWQFPEIQTGYRMEMQRLLDEVWDEETLLAELLKVDALCREHLTVDTNSVSASQAGIRAFIENRRKEVQAELEGPQFQLREKRPLRVPAPAVPQTMEIYGTFSAVMQGPTTNWHHGALLERGSASAEFTVNGRRHKPFVRSGAIAHQSQGAAGYPSVWIALADEGGEFQWNLTLSLDPHQARSGAASLMIDGFCVHGVLTQGLPGSANREWRILRGKAGSVDLETFTLDLGGRVSGKFKVHTTAFEEGLK